MVDKDSIPGYEVIHLGGGAWTVCRGHVGRWESLTRAGGWVGLFSREFVWNEVCFPSREAAEETLALAQLTEESR